MNTLWLPESAKEILCVGTDELEDEYTASDTMMTINSATVDWLNGQLDTGTYTDILLQFGIDPRRIDHLALSVGL